MPRIQTGWAVVALLAWSMLMWVALGAFSDTRGGILCPSDNPDCHTPHPPPVGALWVIGVVVIIGLTLWPRRSRRV